MVQLRDNPTHVQGHMGSTPMGSRAWLAMGRSKWESGAYLEARSCFRQAFRLRSLPETLVPLVQANLAMAEFQAAETLIHQGLTRWPDEAALWLFAALAALNRGAPKTALDYLDRPSGHGRSTLRDLAGFTVRRLWNIGPEPQFPKVAGERARALWDAAQFITTHRQETCRAYPSQVLIAGIDAAPEQGLVVECGVYWGRSIRIIADRIDRPIHGFDSFQGLPHDWKQGERSGSYSTGGRLPTVPDHVVLHPGWFEDTLPAFVATQPGPVSLLHIDCDLYESTKTVLSAFGDRLVEGTIIVFDDFIGYPGWQLHEYRAWQEFCAERNIGCEVVATAFIGREVAVRITDPGGFHDR